MESPLPFTGRNIAVTGGFSGIGLALVKTLLELGANVFVADIATKAPDDLINRNNVQFTLGCNITLRDACQNFVDSIPGRLDGLVNSAGISKWEGKIATDELYQQTMDVNVTGTWNMGTAALARMQTQEDIKVPGIVHGSVRNIGAGAIVNVGSGASLRGVAGLASYSASKHAVLGLTRSWARDFPTLRVNLVAPGATETPLVEVSLAGAPRNDPSIAFGSAQVASIPKGRMAYATDVADAIVFLLSDWSSFITGQCLPVNGGNQ